jgi:predicted dehydrogenase/predicted GNAT family N-acyltransferase
MYIGPMAPATTGSRPVRVGFLGAGLIATYHSKSLRRSGADVVRTGVYDIDRDRAVAFAAASGHTVMASEDEVIDSADAVYVCTWTSEHPRQVRRAFDAGKHVFCEKPLAITTELAAEMAAHAARSGLVHQVGLILRRSPAYLWARHLIGQPAAGRVMAVVFRDDQFIPTQGHYASVWRADRSRAGAGTLIEHSIHDVDMLRFLVGDIASVSAHTTNFHGHDGIEDVCAASIRFASGAVGTLTSVWHDNLARPSLRRVEVLCERRHITIHGDDWLGPIEWTDSDGTTTALEGAALEAAVDPLRDGDSNPDDEFIRAIQRGHRAWPDLSVAVEAHRVVDAMYRSAAAGGTAVAVATPSPERIAFVDLAPQDTHDLRRRVLRVGVPTTQVEFAEDTWAGVRHLGATIDGRLVGVSTWVPRPWAAAPHLDAVQLRGMATDPELQSTGIGGALLEHGCALAATTSKVVWARARDAALAFYERHGFMVIGDGFIDEATQLPHHLVIRQLPGR